MDSIATKNVVHVWQDNETDVDLLGFQVHADLIRSVITNPKVLPVTVGVFGDWGGGKSSIMKMLRKDLSNENVHPNVVCMYFNGWTFEGYEDAKSALLTSILIELGEHKKFGPRVKEWVVKLLKRVKVMELGKAAIKHIGVPLVAAAFSGGSAAIPAALAAAAGSMLPGAHEGDSDDEIDWSGLIEASPAKADLLGVRKFRNEFAKMLDESKISSLIVLIDDLDRCLPERLIETLEAIKLFVAVPRTAFVIGADPRIVRHAISTRYVKRQLQHSATESEVEAAREEEKLVQDYLEKLIQIPYQLPRLSPSEIETYINLLACEKFLDEPSLAIILEKWRTARELNVYAPFTAEKIQKAVGEGKELPAALKDELDWSTTVASVITDGLKGNPRQVKRMLNAMSLRKQLASVARISIKDEVLAKLMVLEYSNLPLFQELNQWQAAEEGVPSHLKKLEADASKEQTDESSSSDTALAKWKTPSVASWLRMKPPLANVDLRDYFWLARDRTGSTLTGVAMVPPAVQVALQGLMSDNAGENAMGLAGAQALAEQDRNLLLNLLGLDGINNPGSKQAWAALHKLAVNKLQGAGIKLMEAAQKSSVGKLRAAVPQNIAELAQQEPTFKQSAVSVLTQMAKEDTTQAGKAAKIALGTLTKKVG